MTDGRIFYHQDDDGDSVSIEISDSGSIEAHFEVEVEGDPMHSFVTLDWLAMHDLHEATGKFLEAAVLP